jgi:hypothetical protein
MQSVLTSAIALWKFRSPLGLQLPKWELTWECESSSSHSLTLLLAHTLASLCLGCKPKARVATIELNVFHNLVQFNQIMKFQVLKAHIYLTFHVHASGLVKGTRWLSLEFHMECFHNCGIDDHNIGPYTYFT